MIKSATNPTNQTESPDEPSVEDLTRVVSRSDTRTTLATASRHITTTRQLDHNDECVGCGAHRAEPCHPTCPFETGMYAPAVLLRAAAQRIREHPAGVGYDISGALFAAALDLVNVDEAAAVVDEAREILTSYLVDQWGAAAEAIRPELVYRHGLFTDLPEIALSLYTAATRHDDIDFDPAILSDFTALARPPSSPRESQRSRSLPRPRNSRRVSADAAPHGRRLPTERLAANP